MALPGVDYFSAAVMTDMNKEGLLLRRERDELRAALLNIAIALDHRGIAYKETCRLCGAEFICTTPADEAPLKHKPDCVLERIKA